MDEALKPCPFCDGRPRLESTDHGAVFFVACLDCACEGPWRKAREGAKQDWNRRTPAPDEQVGALLNTLKYSAIVIQQLETEGAAGLEDWKKMIAEALAPFQRENGK